MKRIFRFGFGDADGSAHMKDVLGGKGANLAEMSRLAMPVPPGVTIPTYVLMDESIDLASYVTDELMPELYRIEKEMGYMPMFAVRSGAASSMPGMMDTILNVGLNDETLPQWIDRLGEHSAWDCYVRLVDSVLAANDNEMAATKFKIHVANCKYGSKTAPGSWDACKNSPKHLAKYVEHASEPAQLYGTNHGIMSVCKASLDTQLLWAIGLVRKSWNSKRAVAYRKKHGIPESMGTACNVQSMVFGNAGLLSCSGVLFSRNPATGQKAPMGEFLVNAQGEEVVAGTATPAPLVEMEDWHSVAYYRLLQYAATLETHYGDMQDIEFTVQHGDLYLLQCRSGKRTALAAFQIAHDLAMEGVVSKTDSLKLVTADQFYSLNRRSIDPAYDVEADVTGIAGSNGIATGIAVFSSEDAVNCTEPCILVTRETTPEDFEGMDASVAIVTQTGGQTSHAAVVARQLDKPCVVGCTDLVFDDAGYVLIDGTATAINEGTPLTVDGSTGSVWVDKDVPVIDSSLTPEAQAVFEWGKEAILATGAKVRMTLDDWLEAPIPDAWVDLGSSKNAKFKKLLESIGDVKPSVIDLSTQLDWRRPQDTDLLNVFGDFTSKELERESLIGQRVELLTSFVGTKDTVLKLPSRVSADIRKKLDETEWSVLTIAMTLDDLLDADGALDIDDTLRKSLGDSLPKVLQLMKEAGRVFYALDDTKHLTRLVFEVFGT